MNFHFVCFIEIKFSLCSLSCPITCHVVQVGHVLLHPPPEYWVYTLCVTLPSHRIFYKLTEHSKSDSPPLIKTTVFFPSHTSYLQSQLLNHSEAFLCASHVLDPQVRRQTSSQGAEEPFGCRGSERSGGSIEEFQKWLFAQESLGTPH